MVSCWKLDWFTFNRRTMGTGGGECLKVNRAWCVCSPISVTQSVCMTISILLWCLRSSFLVLHNLVLYHTTSHSLAASCRIHWCGSHFSKKLRQLQLRRGNICERPKYSLRAPHSTFTPNCIKPALSVHSGLTHESEVISYSVVSDSLQPHGL